jgi:hypothetical protein
MAKALGSNGAKAKARRLAAECVAGLPEAKRAAERRVLDAWLSQIDAGALRADAPKVVSSPIAPDVTVTGTVIETVAPANGSTLKSRKVRRPEVYQLVTKRRTIPAGAGRCFYSTTLAWELWTEADDAPARRIERLPLKVVLEAHQITVQEASNG